MPNHVFNTITIDGDTSIIKLLRTAVRSDNQPFDFNRIIPKPAIVDLVCVKSLDVDTERRHPNPNWYDWQATHWGTKWNAYDFDLDFMDGYCFCTAWSPPIPVIKTLSSLFPELTIELHSEEEMGNFSPMTMTFRGGSEWTNSTEKRAE